MNAHLKSMLLSLLTLLFCFTAIGVAQNTYNFNPQIAPERFVVDYAYFKTDDPDKIKLELYYRLYNSSLQYVASGNKYRAEYEISVVIYDKNNRQMTAFTRDKKASLHNYDNTVSVDDFRINQIDHIISPGKYKIEIMITDKNSGNKIRTELKIEIPKFKSKYAQFSGIEFVQMVDTVIVDSVFRKGNLSVIPAASRRFTVDTSSGLVYYFEIYKGSGNTREVLLETRILNNKMNKVYSDTVTVTFEEDYLMQLRKVSLRNFKSGDYMLELVVLGPRNREMNKIRQPFTIFWPPDQMILIDYDNAVRMLRYIADPADSKKLKTAQTPEERLALFKAFWKSKDPTPETSHNELKEDYYKRIEYANRYFSVMKKDGWKTDFGMIYIQYGMPDQIEDFPFEMSTKAYQIWYYYQLKEPLKFIFVDDHGDGDYRLQYPYDGKSW